MNARIFRYVVRYDTGSAPNPYGGWCSLAICKPRIRSTARVGDWVIGLRSRKPKEVIYVMQVQEVLPFSRYWSDKRFEAKKPGECQSSDNIYRADRSGALKQVPNAVHGAGSIVRDLSCQNVLLSQRFWYFGDKHQELTPELMHLKHKGRGHSCNSHREGDSEHLARWLGSLCTGIHGDPVDAAKLGKSLGNLGFHAGASKRSLCPSSDAPASVAGANHQSC